MNESEKFNLETLKTVLNKKFGNIIVNADYVTELLRGGTVGNVNLITGTAETAGGEKIPFSVVLKIQKKWKRPGDTNSWRREYDLYMSELGTVFPDSLGWPECYYAEIDGDETHLWMEYIDGISGSGLTLETLEHIALKLGRYQGKIYKQPDMLKNITCLSEPDALEKNFEQWHNQIFTYEFLISEQCRMPEFLKQSLRDGKIRLYDGKSFEYGYLRSEDCGIPEHLKQMLTDIDNDKEAVFKSLKRLPTVFSHRDFWIENIFYSDGKIRLIDWDCAGWGHLGEDIASLIYDDTKTENLHEYFHRLIPAYIKGFSEYLEVPHNFNAQVRLIILLVFGYRAVRNYMFSESAEVKAEAVNRLQKVCEMKGIMVPA